MVRSSAPIAVIIACALFGCQSRQAAPEPVATKPVSPVTAPKPPAPKVLQRGLQHQTIILTYHDMVRKRDKSALWFDCTPGELEAQIAMLKKSGFEFVSLDTVVDRMTGSNDRYPARAVAITFADNYQGYADLAEPILARYKIPVTHFVHTGHVGSQTGRPKMSWETLRDLQKTGRVSVQSQTVSHPLDLRKLSEKQIAREFLDSREAIETNLQAEAPFIAYPNGKFDSRVMESARSAGYACGFTEEQLPAESAEDLLAIPRYVHTKYIKAIQDVIQK